MPVNQRFHLSVYITLGVACASLGYAELGFLPEISILAAIVAALLVVAYQLEGRWSLSLRAANVLGGLIGIGAICWVAVQFFRPWGGTLLDQLPWPTSLLPYLGPLLMILIPAKLFRPKHDGDFWGLHGIGLIAVALGCALAGDLIFGGLLVVYVICLMWSLNLFYFYRGQRTTGLTSGARRWAEAPRAFGQAGRWAGLVTVLALIVFLATPRSGDARWQLAISSGHLQTGYADERPSIDLNHSGTLSVNREVAFSVRAYEANGQARLGLDPATRWRGATFNHYENGRWEDRQTSDDRGYAGRGSNFAAGASSSYATLPDLDPRQFILHFFPNNRMVNPSVLAEPVWHKYPGRLDRRIPVVSIFEGRPHERPQQVAWQMNTEYDLRPPTPSTSVHRLTYKQVVVPPEEPGLGPPVMPVGFYLDHMRNCSSVPSLRDWTAHLLRRLAEQKKIPAEALASTDPDDPSRIAPEAYEPVARALEAHLSSSGEYQYTLNLQRMDTTLDPIEDFLFHTRRGHCNRYSTALTLMLRSQGIPARIVLGFRGVDEIGEGLYEVRQSYAHSWVEAMVRRPRAGGDPVWHWLTLDPTPAGEAAEVVEFRWGQWWEDVRLAFSSSFKQFVVDYDADQQDRARSSIGDTGWAWFNRSWRRLMSFVTEGTARFVVLALAVAGVAGWRFRRRRTVSIIAPPPDAIESLFDRLLGLLARIVGRHAPGQTARELAAEAANRLRAQPATLAYADWPPNAVDAYYRARFGRQPIDAADRESLGVAIDQCAQSLTMTSSPEAQGNETS